MERSASHAQETAIEICPEKDSALVTANSILSDFSIESGTDNSVTDELFPPPTSLLSGV